MQRLTYSAPAISVFPPVTVAQTTTTGREGWRTDIRRPPMYGVYGVASKPIAPLIVGLSTVQRLNLMQPSNPHGVYFPIDSQGGK